MKRNLNNLSNEDLLEELISNQDFYFNGCYDHEQHLYYKKLYKEVLKRMNFLTKYAVKPLNKNYIQK